MKKMWSSVGTSGKRLTLYNLDEKELGELLLWKSHSSKIVRINWIMVKKEEQGKGLATFMLQEVKNNIQEHFPEVDSLLFEGVTSIKMLNTIKKVFDVKWHINEHLPQSRIEEIRSTGIQLPQNPPAKYNKDGSCRISKNALKENFITYI